MSSRPPAWEEVENPPTALEMSIMKRVVDSGYDLSAVRQAVVEAGVSRASAPAVAGRALKRLSNNPIFQKALKKYGITLETMAEKLKELLEAEIKGEPDNIVRLKALDMAIKVQDAYPSTKIEIDKNETHQIIISGEVLHAVERVKGVKIIDVEPESGEDPRPPEKLDFE